MKDERCKRTDLDRIGSQGLELLQPILPVLGDETKVRHGAADELDRSPVPQEVLVVMCQELSSW